MRAVVTVEKLLTIPKLRDVKVVAGEGGLRRTVAHVTVMEVPDIVRWLKGGDFLITSLYAVRDDAEAQCRLLTEIAFSSCACVAVKTGQYVEELSRELKDIADRYKIPLLSIPYNLNYIDIIVTVMNYLFEERNPRVVLEKYIKDAIFEAYSDEEVMAERGNMLGIPVGEQVFCAMTIQFAAGHVPDEPSLSLLHRAGVATAQFASALPGLRHCIAVNTQHHSSILLDSEDEKTIRRMIPAVEAEADAQLRHLLPDHRFHAAYGDIAGGVQGIRDTYFHSLDASRTGQVFFPDQFSYCYRDMEVYCVITEAVGRRSTACFRGVLDKISSEDILKTLVTYFESDTSIGDTAAKLYAHRNTIKYRLRRVTELTGLNPYNFNDGLRLFMAVAAYKIRGDVGRPDEQK